MKWAWVLAIVAAGVLSMAGTAGAVTRPACERGEFCWWPGEQYRGPIHRLSLATVNPGECVQVGPARAFVNRMSRPVTVYQGAQCDTEGEFDTYPGGGTYVPEAPYVITAVQVWER